MIVGTLEAAPGALPLIAAHHRPHQPLRVGRARKSVMLGSSATGCFVGVRESIDRPVEMRA